MEIKYLGEKIVAKKMSMLIDKNLQTIDANQNRINNMWSLCVHIKNDAND